MNLYLHFLFEEILQVLEDPLPEGIKSTLVIRDSRQEHYGSYNCSVTNKYGTDVADITLKLQSKNFHILGYVTKKQFKSTKEKKIDID